MKRDRSIDSLLSETGSRAYRGVREQVHLQSNHPVPAAGVFEGWQARPASWRAALSGGAPCGRLFYLFPHGLAKP